ncbi:MAG TPA: MFS transporter [Streptosporangiaceae bacterium]|nr:MFS transporter [Streptosporangiaceae bacterium]
MREATAVGATTATTPPASHHVDNSPADADTLPILQKPFSTKLTWRWRSAKTVLSSSPFRTLMVGSSISMFGSRISTVAFPLLVLHLENSPLVTGLVAFAAIAPCILVYIPAGALVDRWDPRRVMLRSELLRGLAIMSVVVVLAIYGRHTPISFLIIAMVAEEIFAIFFTLADRRYLSKMIEREKIASRQAYVEARSHTAVLAGRPLGPLLFVIQPLLPFLVDAISFLFSIGSLMIIRRADEPVRESKRVPSRQLAKDVGHGFDWLKKDRRAFATLILMAAGSMVAQALILVFLSAAHTKEVSTTTIGIILAASGAGGAVGSVIYRFLPDWVGESWLPIQMAAWGMALAFLWMIGGGSGGGAAAMLIIGLTGAIGNIGFGAYLVTNVDDDMIATVSGIGQMLAIGAYAVGPVVGGAAVQHAGVDGAIGILFAVVVLLLFFSLLIPEVRTKAAGESQPSLRPEPFPLLAPSTQSGIAAEASAGSYDLEPNCDATSDVADVYAPLNIFAWHSYSRLVSTIAFKALTWNYAVAILLQCVGGGAHAPMPTATGKSQEDSGRSGRG